MKLEEIFSRIMEIKADEISGDTSKLTLESWDSFNHLMLVSEIEQHMGIVLTMEEVENIEDYKTLEEIVLSKGGN